MQKHLDSPDLVDRLDKMGRLLKEAVAHGFVEEVETMLDYIIRCGQQVDLEHLQVVVSKHLSEKMGEYVMTNGERLIAQGVAKGKAEGKADLIRRFVKSGFDPVVVAKVAEMPLEEIEEMISH